MSSVQELDASGNIINCYVHQFGIDSPLSVLGSTATVFFTQDGLGSITSLEDSTGSPVSSFVYDAFGLRKNTTGNLSQPYRYTARDLDRETGAYYYRARYYDPSIGRFISADPIGFNGGINFYQYAVNNPANLVDPTGWLAELYCDNIPSSRGGARNSLFLLPIRRIVIFVSHATEKIYTWSFMDRR